MLTYRAHVVALIRERWVLLLLLPVLPLLLPVPPLLLVVVSVLPVLLLELCLSLAAVAVVVALN